MEEQQQIYNYLIHPGTNFEELVNNFTYTLQRLNNLFIISYGDGVTLAIRVAEQLQRNRVAFKISVHVGFHLDGQIAYSKIMILMSTIMASEFPLDMPPDYVIIVDPMISCIQEAYAALEQGKILCLAAFGSSIPNLISLFVILRDYLLAARISISTGSDEQNQRPSMSIKIQGAISMQPNQLLNSRPQYVALKRKIEMEQRLQRDLLRLRQGLGPLPHYPEPIENGLRQLLQEAIDTPEHRLGLPPQFPGHNLPPQVVQTVAMNSQREEDEPMQTSAPLSQSTGPIQNVAMTSESEEDQQMQIDILKLQRFFGYLPESTGPVQNAPTANNAEADF
ncbi:uncharacterized protein [Typha angustifolia]|uniref:uncharacterized protein n=1 Tax=Typha angustifolia TaxID=59011 RepID=UPI003C2F0A70